VGSAEPVGVGVSVDAGVSVHSGVSVAVGVSVSVGVTVGVGVADGVGVAVGVGVERLNSTSPETLIPCRHSVRLTAGTDNAVSAVTNMAAAIHR